MMYIYLLAIGYMRNTSLINMSKYFSEPTLSKEGMIFPFCTTTNNNRESIRFRLLKIYYFGDSKLLFLIVPDRY